MFSFFRKRNYSKIYMTISIIIVLMALFINSQTINITSTNSNSPRTPIVSQNRTNTTSSTNQTSNYSDMISSDIYYSKLQESDRERYMYWIRWKNGLASGSDLFLSMTKSFEPQSDVYYSTLYKHGWVFYGISCFFFSILLLYLILRLIFGKCKGPKTLTNNIWYSRSAWIFAVFGFSISMLFISMGFYQENQINYNLIDLKDYLIQRRDLLSETMQNITDGSNNAKSYNYSIKYNNLSGNMIFDVYGYDSIKVESEKMKNNLSSFINDISNNEQKRHGFSMSLVILLPILAGLSILFYVLKKQKMILILSISIFLFIIPHLILMGLNTSFFLLSIDGCQNINDIVTNETIPILNEGIGFYTSCASKSNTILLKTARYQLYNTFDIIFNDINLTLNKINNTIVPYKRNNTYFLNLIEISNDKNLQNGFKSLIELNRVLKSIENHVQCSTALSLINYSEERFCNYGMNYIFYNIFYSFFAIFGLIIFSIGINKLVIVVNPKYYTMNDIDLLNESFT